MARADHDADDAAVSADADEADPMASRLAALLPGMVEPATEAGLIELGDHDPDRLEAEVAAAWRAGALHRDDGMWWHHGIVLGVPGTDAHDATGTVDADALAAAAAEAHHPDRVPARMRRLADEGRPELAIQLGMERATELLTGDPAAAIPLLVEIELTEVGVSSAFALVEAGRVHAAETIARTGHAEGVRRGARQVQGWFAAVIGVTRLVVGRTLDARRSFTEARLLGRLTNDARLLDLATGALHLSYAMVGAGPPPLDGPDFATPDAGPGCAIGAVPETITRGGSAIGELGLRARARAWSDPSPATLASLAAAATDARRQGRYGVAATLAGDLALLGDPAAACATFVRFGPLDGELLPLWPQLAEAIAAADPVALSHLGDRFESLGFLGMAAAIAVRAAGLALHAGQDDAVRDQLRAANRRGAELQLGAPYLAQFRRLLPLSERETEIASLAAAGRTNKEIADALVVSIRTVENHLYRVYDKLGVDGREGLSGLVPRADP